MHRKGVTLQKTVWNYIKFDVYFQIFLLTFCQGFGENRAVWAEWAKSSLSVR